MDLLFKVFYDWGGTVNLRKGLSFYTIPDPVTTLYESSHSIELLPIPGTTKSTMK